MSSRIEHEGQLGAMGEAFKELVHKVKKDRNPRYEGDNPKDAEQTKRDLEELGIVKEAKESKAEKRSKRKKGKKKTDEQAQQAEGEEQASKVEMVVGDKGEKANVRILEKKSVEQHLADIMKKLTEEYKDPALKELVKKYEQAPPENNEIGKLKNKVDSDSPKISDGERLYAANLLIKYYRQKLSRSERVAEMEYCQNQIDRYLEKAKALSVKIFGPVEEKSRELEFNEALVQRGAKAEKAFKDTAPSDELTTERVKLGKIKGVKLTKKDSGQAVYPQKTKERLAVRPVSDQTSAQAEREVSIDLESTPEVGGVEFEKRPEEEVLREPENETLKMAREVWDEAFRAEALESGYDQEEIDKLMGMKGFQKKREKGIQELIKQFKKE